MREIYLLFAFFIVTSSFGQITLEIADGPPNGGSITIDPEGVTTSYINFTTTNFGVGEPGTETEDQGYIQWTLKNSSTTTVGSGTIYTADPDLTEYQVTGLTTGAIFNFKARLLDNSGALLDPDIVYELEVTVAEYIDVANLGALRSSTVSDEIFYKVTGEVFNTFSRDGANNQKYFQDATGAILVYDEHYEISTAYNIGDGITNIRGHLRDDNGVLQFIPTETDWGAANSTGNIITPQLVDIATLNGDIDSYESRLIKINAITFDDAGGNFTAFNNYNISDISGTAVFKTNFNEVDYVTGENLIPGNTNDLFVLVGEFNGTAEVTARSMDDIIAVLSIEKNDIEGVTVYPNPVHKGSFKIMSTSEFLKSVQLYNTLGIQVLNKIVEKDENIDVSKLITGLYILKIEEQGRFTTRKLIIK